jgi:hypothetical protein
VGAILGQKSEKNLPETLFIGVLGRGFINTFINTLFINPDLKTVYNGPGNYKQGPIQ